MFGIITIGGIDITVLFIIFAVVVIIPVQLLLCFKAEKLWTRLTPIFFSSLATIVCIVMSLSSSGWDTLGWLIIAIYCISSIAVCGIGWLVWFIVMRAKSKK